MNTTKRAFDLTIIMKATLLLISTTSNGMMTLRKSKRLKSFLMKQRRTTNEIRLGLSGLEKAQMIKRLWVIMSMNNFTFQVPVFAGKGRLKWK